MERAETAGLAVAVIGHGALVAALVLGLSRAAAPPLSPPSVEVSIVADTALDASSPSQEAAQAATSPDPAPLTEAEPEPAPPSPSAPAPEPAPAPAPRPEPRPEPKPEPRPRATPAAPPKTAAPAKAAAPTKATAKPAPKPDTPRTAAKAPSQPATKPSASARSAPAGPSRSAAADSAPRGSRLGPNFLKGVDSASEGRSATPPAAIKAVTPAVQRSLAQAISRKLKPHWRAPPGVDVELLVSKIGFRLARDGRVIGRPRLLAQSGRNDSNAPQAPLHAEAAIAAVMAAQPFDLPADYYEEWKDVQFTFDRKL